MMEPAAQTGRASEFGTWLRWVWLCMNRKCFSIDSGKGRPATGIYGHPDIPDRYEYSAGPEDLSTRPSFFDPLEMEAEVA